MMAKRGPPSLTREHFLLAWDAFCFIAYGCTKRLDPQQIVNGMQHMIDHKMVEKIDA